MTSATPEVDMADPPVSSAPTGKALPSSIAKKKFSKAVNLVKFAMKFDNKEVSIDDSKSAFSQKSAAHIGLQMENSYRLEPDEQMKFRVKRVQKVIEEVFENHLSRYHYEKSTAPNISQTLVTVIKDRVKTLGFKRYKIVCNVFIGALCGQGLEATSRCLWDDKKDSFATATYQGGTFVAIAMVHACYFE